MGSGIAFGVVVSLATLGGTEARPVQIKNVAGIVTVYHHNAHADVILGRLLETDTLDGKGKPSPLKLVSLYTDQVPKKDTSRALAASNGFEIYPTIEGALTLGTGKLAVDGVLLIAEHGEYPESPSGNTQYPKRRFFDAIVKVFKAGGRVVPIFCDKHLSDNWGEAKYIYDTAREMKIPLMAGSSLPTTWRKPAVDVERGAELSELVVTMYGPTDRYGFHALETLQALAEQRKGGETGIKSVRCRTGDAIWESMKNGLLDPELFDAAVDRVIRPLGPGTVRERVENGLLMTLQYADGLRAHVAALNGYQAEWTAAWRYKKDRRIESANIWVQDGRPFMHFTYLLQEIEELVLTRKTTRPVERTLLTSGALDALLLSKLNGGVRIETPYLLFSYANGRRWQQPPPPPPTRPWTSQ
jgi:hypothetical protein